MPKNIFTIEDANNNRVMSPRDSISDIRRLAKEWMKQADKARRHRVYISERARDDAETFVCLRGVFVNGRYSSLAA